MAESSKKSPKVKDLVKDSPVKLYRVILTENKEGKKIFYKVEDNNVKLNDNTVKIPNTKVTPTFDSNDIKKIYVISKTENSKDADITKKHFQDFLTFVQDNECKRNWFT